jgi:hypothetical protein
MNWISVASGVRLLKCVSLMLAMPFWPLSSVSQILSLGKKPSAVRDMNSPRHDWRPDPELVTVTCTSTFSIDFRLDLSMTAFWDSIATCFPGKGC